MKEKKQLEFGEQPTKSLVRLDVNVGAAKESEVAPTKADSSGVGHRYTKLAG
jgi:hypothetical protein